MPGQIRQLARKIQDLYRLMNRTIAAIQSVQDLYRIKRFEKACLPSMEWDFNLKYRIKFNRKNLFDD